MRFTDGFTPSTIMPLRDDDFSSLNCTDYANIFDEENFDEMIQSVLQGDGEQAAPIVCPPSTNQCTLPNLGERNILGADFSTGTVGRSANGASLVPEDFVNVLLIVDPTQQKVIFPKQVLSYNRGGTVSTTVIGPGVLSGCSQEAISQLSTQAIRKACSEASSTSSSPSLSPQTVPSTALHQGTFPPLRVPSPSGLVSNSSMAVSTVTSPTQAPLRALSAYNFFFRDERDRILTGGDYEWTSNKQQQLLRNHWLKDRTQKRRHRKTHGKIDFTTLSKRISAAWKKLPDSGKDFYREIANKDWERYNRELNQQRHEQVCNSQCQYQQQHSTEQIVVG